MNGFAKVTECWYPLLKEHPEWRKGQALMIAISSVDRKLYSSIVNDHPDCDCFYRDDRLNDTLIYIVKYYNEMEGK